MSFDAMMLEIREVLRALGWREISSATAAQRIGWIIEEQERSQWSKQAPEPNGPVREILVERKGGRVDVYGRWPIKRWPLPGSTGRWREIPRVPKPPMKWKL
jgi:hypothetical protein